MEYGAPVIVFHDVAAGEDPMLIRHRDMTLTTPMAVEIDAWDMSLMMPKASGNMPIPMPWTAGTR